MRSHIPVSVYVSISVSRHHSFYPILSWFLIALHFLGFQSPSPSFQLKIGIEPLGPPLIPHLEKPNWSKAFFFFFFLYTDTQHPHTIMVQNNNRYEPVSVVTTMIFYIFSVHNRRYQDITKISANIVKISIWIDISADIFKMFTDILIFWNFRLEISSISSFPNTSTRSK